MSYLRTNYRVTGRQIDITAIGGALASVGSFGGGAGTAREYGGFIMGSFASAVYSVIHPISAFGAMSQYYGSGKFGSGYRIFPIMIKNASQPIGGTASVHYEFHWSVSGSLFWIIGTKLSQVFDSVSGTGVAAEKTIVTDVAASVFASNESIHVVWAGWIVSAP